MVEELHNYILEEACFSSLRRWILLMVRTTHGEDPAESLVQKIFISA